MHRILVVDDESAICWGIEQIGHKLGCEVTTAPSAEEGLRLWQASPFDLTILDIRLPGMDGLSALAEMRKFQPGARVIMMTAFGELDVAMQAIRGGAFEYLVKPFDVSEVRQAIQRGLEPLPADPPPSVAADWHGRQECRDAGAVQTSGTCGRL